MLKLDKSALEAANAFLAAGAMRKEYEKQRETAKKALLLALGDHSDGMLPDGRRVSQTVAHFEEATYTRGAYDSTTVNVSALSTSDIQGELSKLVKPAARTITSAIEAAKPKAKASGAAPLKARVGR